MSRTTGCAVLLVSTDVDRRARAVQALAEQCEVLEAADISSAMDELSLGRPLIVLIDGDLPDAQVTGLLGSIADPERAVLWGGEFRLELLDYGAFIQIPDTVADSVLAAAVARLADVQRAKTALKRQREHASRFDRLLATVEAVRHEVNSPLTAIIAETELLLMEADQLTAEQRSSLETIEAMTQRVRQLVSRLHGLGTNE
ncbi:MAG TPA: histidine kinase dimerization/phospho-acceptor domain-containing protein [Gemmatimonadota bacterium]|nr:histidine kinase dimerization/phospho-acceptor domain-containing protein [Gemmatimonadota bacterium]